MRMRKVCPNLEREDGLDTVLEVPIPEELFMSNSTSRGCKTGCTNMLPWIKPRGGFRASPEFGFGGAGNGTGTGSELQLMLGVVGAPLVPLPVQSQHSISTGQIKEDPFEASMAKYIVQQYVAAAGGKAAVNRINSMYAIGKVWMTTTTTTTSEFGNGNNENSRRKKKEMKYVGGEMGGFVLWQKKQPELWCIELVVSGCKLSAGSDGKVAWRQTPWQQSHASRGPPRPLRRTLQGLDPRSTANLFSNSVCIGEKEIDGDDCFVLRLDAEPETLRARSSNNVEIMRHTVWGHFSQRTGLLVQLDDSHLLRMKGATNDSESVYWETTMASSIEDYRFIEGINIAHSGRTEVSLFRFGGDGEGPTRTRMEEMWAVEEVDFNIHGLCMDCFLPPSDLHDEKEGCDVKMKNGMRLVRVQGGATKLGYSKVAALNIEEDEHENF